MLQKNNRAGGLGAMMDEYERVSEELIRVLRSIPDAVYIEEHPDQAEHCRSIQIIMRHVCSAAFGYANTIRATFGLPITNEKPGLEDREGAIRILKNALAYTEETLSGKWGMSDDDIDKTVMVTSWDVAYTLEQMLEHAIVHIMRHRRQIQRFTGITLSPPEIASPGTE